MSRRVRVLLCVLLVAWCGQAVADGPVNQLTFDPSKTAFVTASGETIAQQVTDPERNRPGAAILTLRYLDTRTVNSGVYLGSINQARHLSWVPSDQYAIAIGQSEPGQPIVIFLPYAGWQANVTYAVRVKPTVLDLLGKPVVDEDTTWTFSVMPVAAGEGTPTEASPRPQETVAEQTLGGQIPGGQNFLFQGAWTDPVTGLAYHRGRWYDPRTASFLSPDPEGDIDSVNRYGFVAGRPHAATDPLGRHIFRKLEVNGQTIHASSPTLDEIHNGQFAVAYSYEVNGRTVDQLCDQQCGLTWTMYAKVFPDSIFSESWEAFYGHPISAVEESLLKLYGRAMWDIKEEVALSAFFSMVPIVAEAGSGTTAVARGARAAPRINLLSSRFPTNASVQELNALARTNAIARQNAVAEAEVQLRPYAEGKGHHVPAKSAFRGDPLYDPQTAPAIPNAELGRLNVDHFRVTGAQRSLYSSLSKTGEPLTWTDVARIEQEALVAGGMEAEAAASVVDRAIFTLRSVGVVSPMRIPWG